MQTQSKFRLLVVRLGSMGDILHALPAVTALRLAHPGWIIDWVVEPRWRALLAAEGSAGRSPERPVLDGLHLAPAKDWRNTPFSRRTVHEIRALRSALRGGNYDAVLDLQGAIRSAVVGRMAGCRRLIGEAEPREWPARWLFTERVVTRGVHVIEQDLELASAVAGDALSPVQPWLPVDSAAEAWTDRLLSASATLRPDSRPWDAARPVALINPGAGWGAKRWPASSYGTVAQALLKRGLRVLINAGPGEEPLADEVSAASGGRAETIAPTLAQLIALTRRMALVIAGDTGPLHLACALGCPVVGIYGPTDPSRNGPFGTRFKVLRSPLSRRDHSRRKAPEAGLLTIQPEDVIEAVEELLAEENAK